MRETTITPNQLCLPTMISFIVKPSISDKLLRPNLLAYLILTDRNIVTDNALMLISSSLPLLWQANQKVSEEGDVLYVFPMDYRLKLAAKSFTMKIEPMLEKGKIAAEYLVRVSFGTVLIASIVFVYTTIIAIASSSRDSDDRDRRGKSHDRIVCGFSSYISPTDFFWYLDPYYYRRRRVRKDDGRMNFIQSVFSFVFGDGDPNQGIAEERWKLEIVEH
ncbi:hypothetical protein OROGR_017674 [Orobanche gracilis]